MTIVYVNDWNGYQHGVFWNLERALHDLAIAAHGKGGAGYNLREVQFESETKELFASGVGGTRSDQHLYEIVNSDYLEYFTVTPHNTDAPAGNSTVCGPSISDDTLNVAWKVQKALYDYATGNFEDYEGLCHALRDDVENTVERAVKEADGNHTAAFGVIAPKGHIGSHIAPLLQPPEGVDLPDHVAGISEFAGDLFERLVSQAYPLEFLNDQAPTA